MAFIGGKGCRVDLVNFLSPLRSLGFQVPQAKPVNFPASSKIVFAASTTTSSDVLDRFLACTWLFQEWTVLLKVLLVHARLFLFRHFNFHSPAGSLEQLQPAREHSAALRSGLRSGTRSWPTPLWTAAAPQHLLTCVVEGGEVRVGSGSSAEPSELLCATCCTRRLHPTPRTCLRSRPAPQSWTPTSSTGKTLKQLQGRSLQKPGFRAAPSGGSATIGRGPVVGTRAITNCAESTKAVYQASEAVRGSHVQTVVQAGPVCRS